MVIIWLNGLFLLVLLSGGIFKANSQSKQRQVYYSQQMSVKFGGKDLHIRESHWFILFSVT